LVSVFRGRSKNEWRAKVNSRALHGVENTSVIDPEADLARPHPRRRQLLSANLAGARPNGGTADASRR